MKLLATILLLVPLLAKGLAVPHCHWAEANSDGPAARHTRLHLHVATAAHLSHKHDSQHQHTHTYNTSAHHTSAHHTSAHHTSANHTAAHHTAAYHVAGLNMGGDCLCQVHESPSPAHEHGVLYLDSYTLAPPPSRVSVAECLATAWLVGLIDCLGECPLPRAVIPQAAGPPAGMAANQFRFLPHVLRV